MESEPSIFLNFCVSAMSLADRKPVFNDIQVKFYTSDLE